MLLENATRPEIQRVAEHKQNSLNLHLASQREKIIPQPRAQWICGVQHKDKETVLFFPAEVSRAHILQ